MEEKHLLRAAFLHQMEENRNQPVDRMGWKGRHPKYQTMAEIAESLNPEVCCMWTYSAVSPPTLPADSRK